MNALIVLLLGAVVAVAAAAETLAFVVQSSAAAARRRSSFAGQLRRRREHRPQDQSRLLLRLPLRPRSFTEQNGDLELTGNASFENQRINSGLLTKAEDAIRSEVVTQQQDDVYDDDDEEEETYKVAFRNTIISIAVSVLFGAGLWFTAGPKVGEEFFAGYIVEKSLSVDNLFVFLLLFDYFKVPPGPYQNRILSWGIAGSVVMRAIMIGLGAAALHNFRGILLVFAGILIYSAVQVLVDVEDEYEENEADLKSNPVVIVARYICESNDSCDIEEFDGAGHANPAASLSYSIFPSTNTYDGDRFFTIEDGVRKATPLFVCMVAVELSDVVFAVDSIPAVFGVTENPLVVFSSNMFAILGLRSLYPVLSKAATDLKYLEPAVAVILAFIGCKMIAEYFEHVLPTEVALIVIISLLAIGVGASIWEKRQEERQSNV